MADRVTEGFSIGVLAARAGVTPGVLRTWENRFGFPRGERSASGHRRFTDADVALVRQVLEVRDSGLPLQVAIDSVVRAQEAGRGAIGVRRSRRGRPRRTSAPPAPARADRRLPRGRGRVPRPRRPVGRAGRLPARPPLRVLAAPLGGARPHRGVGRGRGGLRRRHRPRRRPRRLPGALPAAGRLPAAPGVGRGLPRRVVRRPRGRVGGAGGARVRRPTRRSSAPTAAPRRRRVGCSAGVVRAAGGDVPPAAARLLDVAAPVRTTSAVDADRTWLRALAELDPR